MIATVAEGSPLDAFGMGDFPFGIAVVALSIICFCRAQGTYWLGRGIAAGVGTQPRVQRLAASDGISRALALLHRWGPVAVTLSFFTVGVQTMVNAAAGIVRMPWIRYTLFMIPGVIAWGFIYATVGMAAFLAIVAAAAGSAWGVAAIGAVVLGAAAYVWYRRRRRSRPERTSPRHPIGDSGSGEIRAARAEETSLR